MPSRRSDGGCRGERRPPVSRRGALLREVESLWRGQPPAQRVVGALRGEHGARALTLGEPVPKSLAHVAPTDPTMHKPAPRDRASMSAQRVADEREAARQAMARFVSQASTEVVRREEAEERRRREEIDRRYGVGLTDAQKTLLRQSAAFTVRRA